VLCLVGPEETVGEEPCDAASQLGVGFGEGRIGRDRLLEEGDRGLVTSRPRRRSQRPPAAPLQWRAGVVDRRRMC
jgi:hypothetical protein